MTNFYPFVLRCLDILHLISSSAREVWEWLFTTIDAGMLGEIAPIQLISFTLIASFLIARIVLAINS